MWAHLILLSYCVLIAGASIGGGLFPTLVRLTHTRMQMMMSFVAGLMLGVALLHMLPHAAMELPSLDWAVQATLVGLLMMFFLIRIFHFHQHHSPDEEAEATFEAIDESAASGNLLQRQQSGHDHSHDHDHGHCNHGHHNHAHGGEGASFSWVGLAFGLALHTLIDGMALAASVGAESMDHPGFALLGLGTFLAVVLHKPLDAMSITTVMAAQGWSVSRQRLVNVGFALMCPLGAFLFVLGTRYYVSSQQQVLGLALAFSAGVFLCISLGDLLPEVHFHSHDRGKLSAMLLLGVALAYVVGFLEPKHSHDHVAPHTHVQVKK